jgi:hypothetical protein
MIGTASRIAAGTWTRKIDCHETSSVSRPPTAGPSAAPAAPAVAHARVAERSEPYTAGISSSAAQTAAAPPTACRQRAAISTPIDGASPHPRLATAKSPSPAAVNLAGPTRDAACAAGTALAARTRLNPISTQVTAATETSSSR